MKPSVLQFNALGRPTTIPIISGHIALLVQGHKKEIVRIELLSPDEYGPELHHATNQELLRSDVEKFWNSLDTSALSHDRDWIIDCPQDLFQKATF